MREEARIKRLDRAGKLALIAACASAQEQPRREGGEVRARVRA
jgi:predicted GIY-YIG superfamily endonuclease